MVLLMAVSFSFAQMKNVKEAKSMANDVKPNFKQAEQLIKEAMKNPETKDLADTWDVAGFIQRRINEEQMKNAFLKKPYDTLKVYNSILKMYEYYTKCDELAEIPNEKGKVKNKYRKANASSMLAERPNLINGGIQYFNLDKNKEALKFFATYVESASYPMLADKELAKNDTLIPQIAYYATLAGTAHGTYALVGKGSSHERSGRTRHTEGHCRAFDHRACRYDRRLDYGDPARGLCRAGRPRDPRAAGDPQALSGARQLH